ncbi:hypothetical protein FDC27_09925 [Clostridium botulinum]|uniref:hypothetical protein n=1 Tax=Clostridium botulinum TaxID=1491 RepID=UPI0013C5F0DB|nr:hypothetical protein [Clostridium botulinum]MBY7025054.1 hypothetical protein [Clostridium botulinum]NFE75522.1 hypothetical protein [Clostridium botulinum]NFG26062.1 hypothetical protein [Clostridium botulinum]NFL59283.1 hypothetical protein [Clostridium botulinum]NFL63203.1 hypothetical protein [Clostridium botulinum]
MEYIEIDKRIAHLSEEQIEDLMNKYYSGIKASELVKEYSINISTSMLYKLFPPEVCTDILCPICNIEMVKDRKSKSSYINNGNYEYCIKCDHKNTTTCKCILCEQNRKAKIKKQQEEFKKLKEKKQLLIAQAYNLSRHKPIKFSELSFRDRVYIGALLRTASCEDMINIEPLNKVDKKLAPSPEMMQEIITELYRKEIIVVSPESDIEAFADSDDDIKFPGAFYIYSVKYVLNIEMKDIHNEEIAFILNPDEVLDKDKEEALNIWREIALQECLEYLNYQMKSVKFDFTIGDKTIITFKELLKDFSVSQIYGIIYKSTANATRYYQESNISRKQAANSIVSGCRRYAEKALLEKWDLTKYGRRYDLPQSIISEFFFYRVIKIGELGFDMPPIAL